ncbi:hypothetical protein H0H93_005663 [Arthromyces matolae]|nr:hypothetical protein H0H93_005663 [Arthromyces matolae]
MGCSGSPAEECGAGGRLNLYWSGAVPPPPPNTSTKIGNWTSLGCYTDNVAGLGRSLAVGMQVVNNTNEVCTTACFNAGYPLSGTEYSEAWLIIHGLDCGNTIANGGVAAAAADCSMLCLGNSEEFCGGPNRLNVYNYTGTNLPPQNPGNGGNNGGNGGPTTVFPVTSGLPGNFSYAGCYVDNAFGRILIADTPGNPNNTIQSCINACVSLNYTVAGSEYSGTYICHLGLNAWFLTIVLQMNAIVEIPSSTVRSWPLTAHVIWGVLGTLRKSFFSSWPLMALTRGPSQACGGPNRVSVYSTSKVTILPVPTALRTGLPTLWQYKGCLRSVIQLRVSDKSILHCRSEPTDGVRALPYQIIWPTNNSALACLEQCAAFGFPASGVEYGQECYCGDKTDPVNNGAVFGAESECTLPCPGDPTSLCGSGGRLSYYEYNGTMNLWKTPANIGRYEFFVPGVVVPLIATLGINNKVTFLEKAGTGFPNSTGAYELDLSLVSNFSATWREMHLKSDVFCAGSVILPDKAGRQINVGGWSLDSTYGLRLYTPSGSDGVNGTTDWEEDYPALKLQRGRWYPTASIMANGTILVIGGETGSNASPQPNLETLPTPPGGDTVINLDWLARTDPNNLYPFVFVLPSTRIFVGYWNEARILDPVTFDTYQTLPNIPGSVNDFMAGRTYPLEGSAMLLPQHAPYTDPLKVLICGGSTVGPADAIDNCVSIAPEATNATWELERMPSKRVMPCMVNLPDGTYLIANGAHEGVAGFGLANDPNLNAVLYDPTQPLGQRFSILNNTIVARLYHSELTLLPDGRVLVSGSDPQTDNPDGTVKYPEEFRIEVYIPPYLNQGFRPPEFNISVTDWAYGGKYTINNVKLYQGTTANLRISLLSASSSTHGNSMGARTIFPAFSCSGTTCTITAPPNAGISPPAWHQLFILDGPTPSHSKWVRIGGDPAGLGNWPNLPGFTLPGV